LLIVTIHEEDQIVIPGQPHPTVREYLARERTTVPDALLSQSQIDLGLADIPVERYTSPEFHALEMEKVWKRTWQLACHEDDIPNVGDTLIYELGDISILVVRASEDEITAFPNACLHRGAQLRTTDGNVPELRCPFHGMCWDLKGNLADLPAAWDFPQIDPHSFGLPVVRVGRWERFVFINMDKDAPPLENYMGDVVKHIDTIARPRLRDRFKALHVAKVVACNWKVGLEAFMESWHSAVTHPQAVLWTGDLNSQYDVYPGQPHWNRMVTPHGVPSPLLGPDVGEQEIAESISAILLAAVGVTGIEVPDGETARHVVSEQLRAMLGGPLQDEESANWTDCQTLDTLSYFVFPNTMPFISLVQSIVFRFRPYGNDPNMSIMEVMFFAPVPAGMDRPPAAKIEWAGVDDSWESTSFGNIGTFASFLDQDVSNMTRVQRGMRAATKPGLTFSKYQESRIRHFHSVLGDYVDHGPGE
jgi:phenylpropionate dioxygenase-like ring-hydroxylating dioxygenase large terminal subunit